MGSFGPAWFRILQETTEEKIQLVENDAAYQKLKRDFADALSCPLETSEFQFLWYLNENGLLEDYIEKVQYEVTKGQYDATNQSNRDSDLERFLIELLFGVASKGRVNPRTVPI